MNLPFTRLRGASSAAVAARASRGLVRR